MLSRFHAKLLEERHASRSSREYVYVQFFMGPLLLLLATIRASGMQTRN